MIENNFYEKLVEDVRKEGISRYVVGAVVQMGVRALLVKRPKDDFMGGIYEFPSGKVEEGESLSEALYREVKEESNLNIKNIKKYVGKFDYESKSGKKTRQFNFSVNVSEPVDVKLQEHDDYTWMKREDIDRYTITDNIKRAVNAVWESNE